MKHVPAMVRKDLLRQIRSPLGILFVLSFPVVFAGLLGLTFGTGSQPRIPKVSLLVEDLDQSFLSDFLVSAATNEQTAEYFDIQLIGSEGLELIRQNRASALWRIPENFGRDLLDGNPVEFELIRNPAQSILPEVAEQSLWVLTDFLSTASRVLREPLDELAPMLSDETGPSRAQVADLSVKLYEIIDGTEAVVFPPVIKLDTVQLTEDDSDSEQPASSSSAIFLFILPGISVWALFMVGDIGMRDILTESQEGTLRRQLSGPVRPWELIVGKALYSATLAAISLLLLATIGGVVARTPVDPVGFVTLSLALILAVTGFASVMYGAARTERQGATLSAVVLLVFAFLGGSFVQLDSIPSALRRFSPLTPFYWGTTGYTKLIQGGGGVRDVLPNIGVLAGLGVVLLMAGAVLLGRKVRRGGAG